jgi:predicted Kef-type K+ transport protein
MISLVYASMDASTHQSALSLDSSGSERAVRAFSYPLFHIVFCLGSMYMGMVLSGWSSELNYDSGLKNRFVVKIASAFLLHAIYLWTLVAPSVLSNRRFDYDDL